MNILFLSLGIILLGVVLYLFSPKSPQQAFSTGYLQPNCNPMFFSGNKTTKSKKHNMLRVSKLTKLKHSK